MPVIQINLLLIGHDMSTPLPQTGCRKCLIKFVYSFWARVLGYVVLFTHYSHEYLTLEDVNYYEEWLGTKKEQAAEQASEPDAENSKERRVPKRGPGRCSTIISNHVGLIDILNFVCSPMQPGFVAKDDVSRMKIINALTNGLQSIYITRTDAKSREATLNTIKNRTIEIEDECKTWAPFMIYPEGSTSNGSHILKFKRGAFDSMRTV